MFGISFFKLKRRKSILMADDFLNETFGNTTDNLAVPLKANSIVLGALILSHASAFAFFVFNFWIPPFRAISM